MASVCVFFEPYKLLVVNSFPKMLQVDGFTKPNLLCYFSVHVICFK